MPMHIPKFIDITFHDIDRLRLGGHFIVKAPRSTFIAQVDGRSTPGIVIHPRQPDSDATILSTGRFTGAFETSEQATKYLAAHK